MLINNKVCININPQNIEHYLKLGYDCKLNHRVEIDVNNLSKGSSVKVDVICKCCGLIKSIRYGDYHKNIIKYEVYCCSTKCRNELKIPLTITCKVCKVCNIDKDIDSFYIRKDSNKHREECKSCLNKNTSNRRDTIKKKEYNLIYYKLNKERINSMKNKYKKNRCLNDNLYKLTIGIRSLISISFRMKFTKKSKKTIEILGCSFEEFKIYLESKFEPWMTWENRGLYNSEFNYGWDMDHIIPVSIAKTEEEIIKLNHYTNFQPMCSKINREIKRNYIIVAKKTEGLED